MDVVTGDYIYFLDSDVTISEDCIETLVAPIKVLKGNISSMWILMTLKHYQLGNCLAKCSYAATKMIR